MEYIIAALHVNIIVNFYLLTICTWSTHNRVAPKGIACTRVLPTTSIHNITQNKTQLKYNYKKTLSTKQMIKRTTKDYRFNA